MRYSDTDSDACSDTHTDSGPHADAHTGADTDSYASPHAHSDTGTDSRSDAYPELPAIRERPDLCDGRQGDQRW